MASVPDGIWTSVNVASGNCSQIARSSAATLRHLNLNMYRAGSVACAAFCQLILVTTGHSLWHLSATHSFLRLRIAYRRRSNTTSLTARRNARRPEPAAKDQPIEIDVAGGVSTAGAARSVIG